MTTTTNPASHLRVGQRVQVRDQYSGHRKGATILSISKTGIKVCVAVDGFLNPTGKGIAMYSCASRPTHFNDYVGYLVATQPMNSDEPIKLSGQMRDCSPATSLHFNPSV